MREQTSPQTSRELTAEEVDQVGGGVLPLVGLALAVAGRVFATKPVATWAINAAGTAIAGWGAVEYLDTKRKLAEAEKAHCPTPDQSPDSGIMDNPFIDGILDPDNRLT